MANDTPVHPSLDSELERLFDLDGDQCLKSCLKIVSSPNTDPTALTGVDYRIESSRLLRGLLTRETDAIEGYYTWRMISDRLSQILRMARREAKGHRRRRAFKTGITEVERRYHERNKKPAP